MLRHDPAVDITGFEGDVDADADADNLIVRIAINSLNNNSSCTIVGEDTGLLALLIHKCTDQICNHIPGTQLNPNVAYDMKAA